MVTGWSHCNKAVMTVQMGQQLYSSCAVITGVYTSLYINSAQMRLWGSKYEKSNEEESVIMVSQHVSASKLTWIIVIYHQTCVVEPPSKRCTKYSSHCSVFYWISHCWWLGRPLSKVIKYSDTLLVALSRHSWWLHRALDSYYYSRTLSKRKKGVKISTSQVCMLCSVQYSKLQHFLRFVNNKDE